MTSFSALKEQAFKILTFILDLKKFFVDSKNNTRSTLVINKEREERINILSTKLPDKLPELPEVETVVRALLHFQGRRIIRVEVIKSHLLKGGLTKEEFCEKLQEQSINSIRRKGKHIFFLLDQFVMISHLRMTGKYFLGEKFVEKEYFPHLGLVFYLDDQSRLFFCDARNFATFHLQEISEYKNLYPYNKIGLDLINEPINSQQLHNDWRNKKIPIKAALLEQSIISGIGNIYASEILYLLKIHPLTVTNSLDEKTLDDLLQVTRKMLQLSIDLKGTSIVDFRNPNNEIGAFQRELKVYGKAGTKCTICQDIIKKIFIDNRSTFFCPQCQVLI